MDLGLSEGTLEAICARGEKPPAPVLQVQGYRLLQAQSGSERYRLMLTDGVTKSSSVMLATQLNSLVTDGRVSAGCVVRVDSYSSTELRDGRRLVLLLALEVLRPGDGGGGEAFGTQGEATATKARGLSFHLSTHQSVHAPVRPFTNLSIQLPVCAFIFPFTCLSICLSVRPVSWPNGVYHFKCPLSLLYSC
uniref:Replication protein A 70 kDa DNA-binding subunit-like n=1 Tax=Petromyzon marinus TaxID=7757 RepID=A0AAJ7WMP3_PETMA|nr:replication protein A 70 kDa DNA-binding subunit-like [Petromyzon marinus]